MTDFFTTLIIVKIMISCVDKEVTAGNMKNIFVYSLKTIFF